MRYVALANGGATLAQKTGSAARILGRVTVKGRWGLPLVAYDNTVEGLVEGGPTLLLAHQIYAADGNLRSPTSFKDITIPGTFSFDAASPDGRYVYLIEYFSSADPKILSAVEHP